MNILICALIGFALGLMGYPVYDFRRKYFSGTNLVIAMVCELIFVLVWNK